MLWLLIVLVIVGAIAGFLARLLVPGPDPMSVGRTILLGIVGSFVGGFLSWLLFDRNDGRGAIQASGLVGSVIGAVIALLIYRAVTRPSGRRKSRTNSRPLSRPRR